MYSGYNKKIIYVFSAVLMVALMAPCGVIADDWHQFHGPNRDRISNETGWRTNWSDDDPKVLWKKSIGIGFSSMSIVGDRVFTMGNTNNQETVWCFDVKTGEKVWSHTYDCELFPKNHEGGPGGTPTIDNESVYTVSKEGYMYCLDVKTGKVKWEKDLKKEFDAKMPTWRFALSPLLEGDRLVLDVGLAVVLNKKTGDLIWKSANYGSAYSSPIAFDFNGKRCFAIVPAFGLVVLDASSGKEIGKFKWETRYDVNAATPLVMGNKFFLSSGYKKGGSMVEMSADGEIKELWHNPLMRNHMNATIFWKDYLYGFDEGKLKCINAKTGADVWEQRGLGKGSLMLADGKLIILSEKGELVVAEANGAAFKPLCRKQVLSGRCWTVPVLANGNIYCRNAAGDFICLDVSKK